MMYAVMSLAAFVLITGCGTTSGIRSQPLDTGEEREFPGDYATVLRATRDAVVNAGLAVDSFEEPSPRTAIIVAKKGVSGWSWGELVRVVVEQRSSQCTAVRVLTRRRVATNIAAKGDYSETIFTNIDLALR
jgi:hypothetical protein